MSEQEILGLLPYVFPFLFVGMWLAITTILGKLSGWFTLQPHFPDRDETSRLTLRMQSGQMGTGMSVGLNSVLTLSACPSGLRVKVFRLLAPFQRPFLVPWSQIRAERRKVWFRNSARLSFGRPEIGTLTIDAQAWQRLVAQSPQGVAGLAVPFD